jgi:alkylated DNA repair dioxygenase AlkB
VGKRPGGIQLGLLGGPKGHADGRVEIPLDDADPLVLWRGWIEDSPKMREGFSLTIPWEHHTVDTPAGRMPAPRLECFYADERGATYRYSRETYTARPLADHPPLQHLRDQVATTTGGHWNAVFCNLYRSGDDSIGWHADDEVRSLGPADWVQIASLSLGTSRTFAVKHRETDERVSIELGGGDLLLMGERVQLNYLHSVPKRPAICTARMNFTFRRLVTR